LFSTEVPRTLICPQSVRLDLELERLQAALLRIDLPTVSVRAAVDLSNARLSVLNGEGRVEAKVARLKNFRLELAGPGVNAATLIAEDLMAGRGRADSPCKRGWSTRRSCS
jgi:hypothetical protein